VRPLCTWRRAAAQCRSDDGLLSASLLCFRRLALVRAVRGWRAKRREARAHEAARRQADARGGLRAWRAAAAARRERSRHSAALVAASAICWTGTGLRRLQARALCAGA